MSHRDLKEKNLFLDEHGNTCIGDFGVAREEQDDGTKSVGTYGYIAPEGTLGIYGPKYDVFSIGVILKNLKQKLSAKEADNEESDSDEADNGPLEKFEKLIEQMTAYVGNRISAEGAIDKLREVRRDLMSISD